MRLGLDARVLFAIVAPVVAFVLHEKFLDAHEEMRAAWDSCIGEMRYPRKVCPDMLKNTKHGRVLKAFLDTCKTMMSFEVLIGLTWAVVVASAVIAIVSVKRGVVRRKSKLPRGIVLTKTTETDYSDTDESETDYSDADKHPTSILTLNAPPTRTTKTLSSGA